MLPDLGGGGSPVGSVYDRGIRTKQISVDWWMTVERGSGGGRGLQPGRRQRRQQQGSCAWSRPQEEEAHGNERKKKEIRERGGVDLEHQSKDRTVMTCD